MSKNNHLIYIPENLSDKDFETIISIALNRAIKQMIESQINNTEYIDGLKNISDTHKQIVTTAIKIAAKDGLYVEEVNTIVQDIIDMKKHSDSREHFMAMINNPYNPKFQLSTDTVKAVAKYLKENNNNKELLFKQLYQPQQQQQKSFMDWISECCSATKDYTLPILKQVAALAIEKVLPALINKASNKMGLDHNSTEQVREIIMQEYKAHDKKVVNNGHINTEQSINIDEQNLELTGVHAEQAEQ